VGAVVRLADLRLRQGRLGEAAILLNGCESDPAAARPLARLRLTSGDTEGAAALLVRRLVADRSSVLLAPETALLAEAYLAAGRAQQAAGLACELGIFAAATDLEQYGALAEYTLGLCAAAAEESAAAEHLDATAAGFDAVGLPLERARSRLALARALAAREPDRAAATAETALREFEQLGAAYDADATTHLLRRLGCRSLSVPRTGGRLTGREAEVLRLIAEGASNSQIAARLFISKRTVEHHVGGILAKLGVATRAEAQAAAGHVGGA
jgi:DNA-binding NarL/FixJ family response regulator